MKNQVKKVIVDSLLCETRKYWETIFHKRCADSDEYLDRSYKLSEILENETNNSINWTFFREIASWVARCDKPDSTMYEILYLFDIDVIKAEEKGHCEDCAKRGECTKTVGNLFGFCETDYVCDFDTWLENHPNAVIQGHS